MRSRKTYVAMLLSLLLVLGTVLSNSIPIILLADGDNEVSDFVQDSEKESEVSEPSTAPSSEEETEETTGPSSEASEPTGEETSTSEENSESTSSENEQEPSEPELEIAPPEEMPSVGTGDDSQLTKVLEESGLVFTAKAPSLADHQAELVVQPLSQGSEDFKEKITASFLADSQDDSLAGESENTLSEVQLAQPDADPLSIDSDIGYEFYFFDIDVNFPSDDSTEEKDNELEQNGQSEPIKITIQGEALKDKGQCRVFHLETNEEVGEIEGVIYDPESGTLTFVASSFSPYAIVFRATGDAIYLDGQNGEDTRDGMTSTTAVKSFGRAREIAGSNQSIKKIYVIGTVDVEGDISLDGTDAGVYRGESFQGYLFKVGPKGAIFNNITLDGSSDKVRARNSLIQVSDTSLEIKENTILSNNLCSGTTGGAIYISGKGSSVTLSGGTIQGNQAVNGGAIYADSETIITLSNGTIQDNHALKHGGGIYLNKATLYIWGGSINKNSSLEKTDYARGGGVYTCNNSNVEMTGGNVSNNEAVMGGGFYLGQSRFDFSGGDINSNIAKPYTSTIVNYQHYGNGGGVFLDTGTTMTMSQEARISYNSAAEMGGGIHVGSNVMSSKPAIFNMIGGSILGNQAGATGGGIFIQALSNISPVTGSNTATITKGYILSNSVTGAGKSNKAFGGGGIYVNGMPATWEYGGGNIGYSTNGQLNLLNSIIKNNEAQYKSEDPFIGAGGGYAACPISNTKVYVNEGVAIYSNRANDNKAKDIYILGSNDRVWEIHGGKPSYEVSPRMLGGKYYHWQDDDGKPVPVTKLKGTLDPAKNESLNLQAGVADNKDVESLGLVFIENNISATRGGGIGSNGNVTFGVDRDLINIQVEKEWDQGMVKEPIVVELRAQSPSGKQDWLIDSVELNDENDYTYLFKDLPSMVKVLNVSGEWVDVNLEDMVYVVEKPSDKYEMASSSVKEVDSIDGNKTFILKFKNYPKPSETTTTTTTTTAETTRPLFTDIRVIKSWDDSDNQDGMRPGSVTFKLLADGKDTGKRLTISAADYWKGYFTDLPTYDGDHRIVYTIEEVDVPDGYQSQISGTSWDGFKVTNVRTNKTVDIEGQKTWYDNDNEAGKRPGSITIRLLKNGVEIDSRTVSEADGWSWSFKDLPQFEDGKLIEYSIVEDAVDGYSSEVSGYDVINHYGTEPTTTPTTEPEETTTNPPTTSTTEPTEPTESTEPTTTPPTEPTAPEVTTPPAPTTSSPGPGVPSTGEAMDYAYYSVIFLAAAAVLLVLKKRVKH